MTSKPVEEEDSYEFSNDPLVFPKPITELTPPEPPPLERALPKTYGTQSLFLIGRDPHWLFLYWDHDLKGLPTDRLDLKICALDGEELANHKVVAGESHWLVPTPRPGARIYAELGFLNESGEWVVLAKSDIAETQREEVSADESATFAVIPFQLAFERLKGLLELAELSNVSFADLLAQISGEMGVDSVSLQGQWTEEQRALLNALAGKEVVERFAADSMAIERLFRRGLLEMREAAALFSPERWARLVLLASGSGVSSGS
ncbi:MAG: DUF4912 domain-containing protein [Verrucomicrobiia bacterium]